MFRHLASCVLAVLACSPLVFGQQPLASTNSSKSSNQIQEVQPFPAADPARLATMTAADLEQLGDDLRGRKEFLQAVDCYLAAIKKSPSAILHNKVGMAYISMMQPDKAKKALERAIKLDKKYPEAYNNLGVVFYMQKNYGKAIKNYRRALAIREESASFHSNLGTAYMQKKDIERGIAEYRRAFEIDPMVFERSAQTGISARMSSPEDRARFCYVMAKLYASSGDFDRSLQWLKKSMEEGFADINNVYKDNEFAKLRADQRFTELMNAKPPAIQ